VTSRPNKEYGNRFRAIGGETVNRPFRRRDIEPDQLLAFVIGYARHFFDQLARHKGSGL
jgi:hypothetical protein